MEQTATNIFINVLIAFLSSWITVQLSLRRFRTEKWWERKADTYTRLIEALHNSKALLETYLAEVEEYANVSKERKTELEKRAHAAYDEIIKIRDVGEFMLSRKALECLKRYKERNTDDPNNTWDEHLNQEFTATKECLEALIVIAKQDLKVTD